MTKEEQLAKSIEWFKQNVKCCNNCRKWNENNTLMYEYAYNACGYTFDNGHGFMTAWDGCCNQYDGNAKEENMLMNVDWEEKFKEEVNN